MFSCSYFMILISPQKKDLEFQSCHFIREINKLHLQSTITIWTEYHISQAGKQTSDCSKRSGLGLPIWQLTFKWILYMPTKKVDPSQACCLFFSFWRGIQKREQLERKSQKKVYSTKAILHMGITWQRSDASSYPFIYFMRTNKSCQILHAINHG